MEEFFTRQKANEGKVLPLYLPSGEKSEHTITILGIDSDKFKKSDAKMKRAALELSKDLKDEERAEEVEKLRVRLIASMVVSWTFEQACTEDNVVKLLTEAPQIAEAVNQFAANRRAFFA